MKQAALSFDQIPVAAPSPGLQLPSEFSTRNPSPLTDETYRWHSSLLFCAQCRSLSAPPPPTVPALPWVQYAYADVRTAKGPTLGPWPRCQQCGCTQPGPAGVRVASIKEQTEHGYVWRNNPHPATWDEKVWAHGNVS